MQRRALTWTARIAALLVLGFGLPFYFGYGNPLPFTRPGYTLFDNLWLTVFPLMFAGLALGWVNAKLGGYLTTISLLAGFLGSLLLRKGFSPHMMIPFAVGALYLLAGCREPASQDRIKGNNPDRRERP